MIARSHLRSSYRVVNDPEQRILAAVVKQAVADVRSRSPMLRAEARQFLADEEGQAWLRHFAGVSARIVREFVLQDCLG
jgi:hypothetical protein